MNDACFAKRRDSLRTYRITAVSSGARGELLEIFSLHTASSQRSPWKRHDSPFYLRSSRSILPSIVVDRTSATDATENSVSFTNRVFARRTNTSQNTNVKDPFFLDTSLGILINTFRETYNRFSWTIRFTYRPSRWLNGLRESIHTWRPTGFIVVRESGHYGILPRSVINGINRSVRDVITSPSVWRSYRE